MKTYKNLIIIGTSHIAPQSIKQVTNIIKTKKPEIIAIELDRQRFLALMQKGKRRLNLRGLSPTEAIIIIIGYYSEKILGKAVGTIPGQEMKTAINLAKENNAKISLIDQNIRITLKRLRKQLTFREKIRFITDIFAAPFQKRVRIDLNKVPEQEIIDKIIKETKTKYPSIYKVLIEERNHIMAKNLYKLIQNNQDKQIVAVVGAGHEKEIIELLKKWK